VLGLANVAPPPGPFIAPRPAWLNLRSLALFPRNEILAEWQRPFPKLRKQAMGTMKSIRQFLRDESGATAVEYGMIVAGIAVAIMLLLSAMGGQLSTTFTSAKDGLDATGK
jgi:pilus assembly protein Flp/PilA